MTLSSDFESARDASVEILVTWGAAVDPALSLLLAAVETARPAREPSPRELLAHAASGLAHALGPELRHRIEEALAGPPAAADLEDLTLQATAAVATRIASRLAATAKETALWCCHGEGAALSPVWPLLGRIERAETLPELIDADKSLERVERLLAERREAASEEIVRLGGERAAAGEGSGTLLRTLRRLRSTVSESEVARKTAALSEASAALAAALENLAVTFKSSEARVPPAVGAILRSAAEAGAAAGELARETPADLDARLSLVRSWTEAVRALTEDPAAWDGSASIRAGLLDSLKSEIGMVAVAAQGMSESTRPAGLAELPHLEAELTAAAERGDASFQPAFGRALEVLDAVRTTVASATLRSAAGLREAAERLASFLERAAAKLPTARVVAARSHVERVESAIADHDIEAIENFQQVIERELETLERDLVLIEKHRRDRDEARRDSQRDQIRRIAPVAKGRASRALDGITKKLASAQGEEIDALRGEISSIRRGIEGEIRVAASRLVERATKRASGDEHLEAKLGKLRNVLGSDDLQAIVASSGALAEALRAASRRRRVWAAVGGMTALIAGGIVYFTYFTSHGPQTTRYEFHIPSAEGKVTVSLVSGGDIAREVEASAGAPLEADLSPGRYEIFVNHMYTGKVLHVPEDASPYELTMP